MQNDVRIVNHKTVWSGCPQFNANFTPFSYKNGMWTDKTSFFFPFNCELVLFYHNKAVKKSRPISFWNCRPSLWLLYILKRKKTTIQYNSKCHLKELLLRKVLQKKQRRDLFKVWKLHFLYKELCALDKRMTSQYRNSNKYMKQK